MLSRAACLTARRGQMYSALEIFAFACTARRLRMVSLTALWLPILLSAIIVFVASSILHMVLPYHRSDYQRLPDEDRLLSAMRAAGVKRGMYHFPFCTHK